MNLVEVVKDYIDGMVMQWPGSGRKALILDSETLCKSLPTNMDAVILSMVYSRT
jgi:hypothetical protein